MRILISLRYMIFFRVLDVFVISRNFWWFLLTSRIFSDFLWFLLFLEICRHFLWFNFFDFSDFLWFPRKVYVITFLISVHIVFFSLQTNFVMKSPKMMIYSMNNFWKLRVAIIGYRGKSRCFQIEYRSLSSINIDIKIWSYEIVKMVFLFQFC